MNHKPAHILRGTADQFNNAYGAREVERIGIFVELEKCSMHGQLGCSFLGPISGHAMKYLQSLGYEVTRNEGNEGFHVGFENATPMPSNTVEQLPSTEKMSRPDVTTK